MVYTYDYFNPDEVEEEHTTKTKTEEEIQKENINWINKINGKKPKTI